MKSMKTKPLWYYREQKRLQNPNIPPSGGFNRPLGGELQLGYLPNPPLGLLPGGHWTTQGLECTQNRVPPNRPYMKQREAHMKKVKKPQVVKRQNRDNSRKLGPKPAKALNRRQEIRRADPTQ